MSTCELCGASFAVAEGLHQVTSTRILCPACDAARRRVQRTKAAKGADADAPPVPASPRARADRRRGEAAATTAPHHHHQHLTVEERRAAVAEKRRRQTTIGMVSVGAGTLILGTFAFLWWSNAAAAEAAVQARLAEQSKVTKELLAYDLTKPEQQQQLLQRAKATAALWQPTASANEIDGRVRNVAAQREKARVEVEVRETMAGIEKALPAATTSAQVAALSGQLAALAPRIAKLGAETQAAHAGLTTRAIEALGALLTAEAKTAAAAAPSLENLAICRSAEDTLAEALDHASVDKAEQTKIHLQIRDLAASCTTLATKLADAGMGIGAWQDLTANPAEWHASQTPGFSVTGGAGALAISGPEPEHKGMGLAVLQKHGPFRDCDVDIECQLDSGEATIFLRLGQKADPKHLPVCVLTTGTAKDGEVAVPAKTPATLHLHLLGDMLTIRGEGPVVADLKRPVPPQARVGSIGIATTAGTVLRMQKLALRELP